VNLSDNGVLSKLLSVVVGVILAYKSPKRNNIRPLHF